MAPAVLGMSLLLEGVSLTVAIRAVRAGAEAAGLTFLEFVRRGMDPTSIAVMMEDSGAVAGLCIAGAQPACNSAAVSHTGRLSCSGKFGSVRRVFMSRLWLPSMWRLTCGTLAQVMVGVIVNMAGTCFLRS